MKSDLLFYIFLFVLSCVGLGVGVRFTETGRAIWGHVRSWLEIYFWIPVALVCIPFSAVFVRWLTGRPPAENVDYIVGYASRLVACILVIALVSVTREATGIWLSKEEAKENPMLAFTQALKACFFAALFAYLLSH